MEAEHRLKELLQLQLASDSYAVLHLPFVLETISKGDFSPSPHTQKWIVRINSLIHSKNPAAKWSGLCLACQTATFSKGLMLECAQSWVGAAMPLLVNQPAPTTKAAIRLLRLIFSNAMDVPEFQRQLCIPNVPKFANSLISLVERDANSEIHVLAIETLTHIVSLYPSLCRPLHGSLSNVALHRLNGSSPTPMASEHVEGCSRLYSVLPLTGGKVNAPNLWRKALDDTVAFAWGAFLQLRTTYLDRGYGIPRPNPPSEDPIIAIPLAMDRLRAAVRVIGDLLHTTISRPVTLPVGPLVQFCSALLQCSPEDKREPHADNTINALEKAAVPTLWQFACEILCSVSRTCQHHLVPHSHILLTNLACNLEKNQVPHHVLQFTRTTLSLVADSSQMHDPVIASRLARATMRRLAVVLSKRSEVGDNEEETAAHGRSKKGKKRARGYEGDEVFKVGREIVCPTAEEGEVLLASVDLLERLLCRGQVSAPVHSIAARLLLSIYASLPQLPPAVLSLDLSLHPRLYIKVQRVCVNLAIGTTSTMSKSLGLVMSLSNGMLEGTGDLNVPSEIDLLLHPRVPPLVRSLPHVEMLSLFRAEESQEEADARNNVGLEVLDEHGQYSDVTEGRTPHNVEQIASSGAPRLPHEVAKTTVAPPTIEPSPVAMQVDVPTPALPVAGVSRVPLPSIVSEAPHSSAHLAHDATTNSRLTQSPLPPPPDALLASSTALGPQSTMASVPPVTRVTPVGAPTDDDEDEPMPTIDLGSDSDSE